MRHFETRVSEIIDHRSDQTEQRVSEQLSANDRRVSEQNTHMAEMRAEMREQNAAVDRRMREQSEQIAEMRADMALLLARTQ